MSEKEKIIIDALESSLYLLNQEFESVILEDLKKEYLEVIKKLEIAINQLRENGKNTLE